MEVVNVTDKLSHITDHWNPWIAGELNDSYVKVVKLKGEFLWHHNDNEDELFFVIKGQLLMRLRDGDVVINPGEFLIGPRGVEHMPVAQEEVHLMLLEPKTTLNTGNVRNERTVEELARV